MRVSSGVHVVLLLVLMFLLGLAQSLDHNQLSGERKVILVTPNLDDDDADGKSDATDQIINGPSDSNDLTSIEVPIPADECTAVIYGPGAGFYRILEKRELGPERTRILIEATGSRSGQSAAILKVSSKSALEFSYQLDIKPFILTSSIDKAIEVFVVEVPGTQEFISDLKSILVDIPDSPKLTVLSNDNADVKDVWIQDATEIGFFEDSSIYAAIAGLRAKYITPGYMTPEILDRYFVEVFCGPDRCVLTVGEPLANRRWIDWFGNLESTPPFLHSNGKAFPWGRILTGRQNKGRFSKNVDLIMQDAVMDFLKDQKVQWPPIVLDTSFLMIGHVDEIINFIPTETGFKTLLAWPSLGRELLEELSEDGYGEGVILEGKGTDGVGDKEETTVAKALGDAKLMAANDAAGKIMEKNRDTLLRELNLNDQDIIELPVVIKHNGLGLWPNPVNGLVLGNHYISPRLFGPIVDARDSIEAACVKAFAGTKTTVHFLDVWAKYSNECGEIHCGTNAVRNRK